MNSSKSVKTLKTEHSVPSLIKLKQARQIHKTPQVALDAKDLCKLIQCSVDEEFRALDSGLLEKTDLTIFKDYNKAKQKQKFPIQIAENTHDFYDN